MKSVTIKSKTDDRGVLRLQIPTDVKERIVDVVVIYDTPKHNGGEEEQAWPEGYFSETYGALASNPLERLPQGEIPEREQLQ